MSKVVTFPPRFVHAIRQRKAYRDERLTCYRTRGGSYIIAVNAVWTDDQKPHDLVLITPWDSVVELRINISPEFVRELQLALANGFD